MSSLLMPVAFCACFLLLIALLLRDCLTTNATLSAPAVTHDKLLEAQKLESLGVLAGGVAHDFNNLLTIILGNTALARDALAADDPQTAFPFAAPDAVAHTADPALQTLAPSAMRTALTESLDQIDIASNRAAELCRQMLACAGKGRVTLTHVDLNDIVSDTVQILHLSISKHATLHLSLLPTHTTINADASQIRQLVMNLVINAADAVAKTKTPPGRIDIATQIQTATSTQLATARIGRDLPHGDYVSLTITDNGCGMDETTLARIFDPFFSTKFAGRGLGLATTPGILRAHHAALFVTSALDQGTTFTLWLPASAGAPTVASDQQSTTTTTSMRQHVRKTIIDSSGDMVLIVDDEPGIRKLAATLVERQGFTPAIAADGYEALALGLAHGMRYRAIILDHAMPGLDGTATLKELRVMNATVPVLLMSGGAETDVRSTLPHDPYLEFLAKPFTPETLNKRLEELTAKTHLQN